MTELPSGTNTLLFTDIEGSTRLLHALGDRYPDVLAAHRGLLRAAFTAHGGIEVDTQGDAFFVVFARATHAVAAAVEAQQAVAMHPWPENGPRGGDMGALPMVRVRMGLHTGEPQRTAEGYAGLDVHRAARICAAGHGGQVLLSQATAELVRHELPSGVDLRDLGEHRLKDLVQPEHLCQLDIPGLPANFPPVRSLDSRPNNLPTPPTPLIGRQREIEEVVGLLRRDGVRLVTLTGPGGTGKTRLGLRVSADLLHDFKDGAFFVSLAPVADPALVASTVLRALGVQETDARPPDEVLTAYLRGREVLLLLDNFEQLLPAAPMLAGLLAACPRLKLLLTSRAAVRLSGARDYAVPPLPLPPAGSPLSPAALAGNPAVALFVERAEAVRADFALTEDNAAAVVAVCARLDGLPLAIELAAARVKLFPPAALLTRLEHRLRVLTGGALDLPARQQTLRDAIGWSYDLLSTAEQKLFRRLGVFVGGWTLEGAEAVCNEEGDLGVDMLDGIAALVDQSLVARTDGPDAEPRFGMLETIREYAQEQLAVSGEQEPARRRHARCSLGLAEAAAAYLRGPEQRAWVARLAADYDNLRAALAWDIANEEAEAALRLAAALRSFWYSRGDYTEGRGWLERALSLPAAAAHPNARARAMSVLGFLATFHGDAGVARPCLEEALAIFEQVGDRAGMTTALWFFAMALQGSSDLTTMRSLLERMLALAQEREDRHAISDALRWLGVVAARERDLVPARALLEESLRLARALGDTAAQAHVLQYLALIARTEGALEQAEALGRESLALWQRWGTGNSAIQLINLGWIALDRGDHSAAVARFAESLALSRDQANTSMAARCLVGVACVLAARGCAESAARLFGAAEAAFGAAGRQRDPTERVDYDRSVVPFLAVLDQHASAIAHAAGRALSLDEAIAEALAAAAPPHPPTPSPMKGEGEPRRQEDRGINEPLSPGGRGAASEASG